MNKADEIMQVLSEHGDGDQIRYFNQIIQQVTGKMVDCKPTRVFDHKEERIGKACSISSESADKFTEWMNDQINTETKLNHSGMIEQLYSDDEKTINALVVFTMLFKKLPAPIFNALLNA